VRANNDNAQSAKDKIIGLISHRLALEKKIFAYLGLIRIDALYKVLLSLAN
jgi:hypothetical protein